MNAQQISLVATLGTLRVGLLALALLNLIPPIIEFIAPTDRDAEPTAWSVLSTVIAPVNAPLLIVVILFDYIMSRIRAADNNEGEGPRFARIARIELAVMALNLLIWGYYFTTRLL